VSIALVVGTAAFGKAGERIVDLGHVGAVDRPAVISRDTAATLNIVVVVLTTVIGVDGVATESTAGRKDDSALAHSRHPTTCALHKIRHETSLTIA
jgi:hypothetical protein